MSPRFLAPLFLVLAGSLVAAPFSDALSRFERAEKSGFQWTAANTFPGAFTRKRAEDGPYGLPLLGGIGTGAFGRDLTGHFNRWQLQPGFPRHLSVDAANLSLRWEQGERKGTYRVGEAGWDHPLPAGARKVAVLWPIVSEHIQSAEWPVELVIESWSPVVPRNDEAASMPVAYFDVYVRNTSAEPARLDLALFMPNFLGWRKGSGMVRTDDDPDYSNQEPSQGIGPRVWPERSNSGNFATPAEPDAGSGLLTGVLMQREGSEQPIQDMEGQVLLGVAGDPDVRARRLVTTFAVVGRGPTDDSNVGVYLDRAEKAFFKTGDLPAYERRWTTTAHEAIASAVAGGLTLAPGAEGHFTLVLAWDTPLVQFGAGRTWEKAYTTRYGAAGNQARRIAVDALAKRAEWRAAIDRWHQATLGGGAAADHHRRGAAINDLFYVVSGGSVWVAKEHPRAGLKPALLGSGEHFSLLEGFDTGYYYNTTFDLWPYAQPALEANWPHLSELVLNDFLTVAPMTIDDPRFFMSTGAIAPRKVANKIPHDLGCPPGDPWNRVNEYTSHRDSNVWKDHNPEFILSLYLHRKAVGAKPPTDAEWKTLLGVTEFMIAQDKQNDGLPYHDAQGDSTWDVLHFTGPSPYSGALTIGAWAAMADWAKQRGDAAEAKRFSDRLARAQQSFEKYFWNGSYYRSASNGAQAEWILTDALFGILMADSCGFHDLLPKEHVAAHLQKVAARNWRQFGNGSAGPSLLAPPTGPIVPGKMQVGEVLVGSARAAAALMQRAGLRETGDAMADAINKTLYEVSGLQFRTPAAWTPKAAYRAPANLRPLSSWYSLWPEQK